MTNGHNSVFDLLIFFYFFQLNEVVITSTGKVVSWISNIELYGGPAGWAPPQVESYFGGASSSLGSMVNLNALPGMTNLQASQVVSGGDGISVIFIVSCFCSSCNYWGYNINRLGNLGDY